MGFAPELPTLMVSEVCRPERSRLALLQEGPKPSKRMFTLNRAPMLHWGSRWSYIGFVECDPFVAKTATLHRSIWTNYLPGFSS